MARIDIYTDGGAINNPGPGGYGIVMKTMVNGAPFQRKFSQGFKYTTNNRMELSAVIEGIKKIKKEGQEVHIHSDSKYVVDAINKGWLENWKKKNFAKIKNPDLWISFYALQRKHQLHFHWVKGHNGHPENEMCDQLAVAASRLPQEQQITDTGYKPD